MNGDAFRDMLGLLRRLDVAKIAYSLHQGRNDALMIEVNVPGERWEIEYVDYGDAVHIEIERFVSNGHIADESALAELFAMFSDKDEEISAGHDAANRE